MDLAISHPWNLPVKEAQDLQSSLAGRVVAETAFEAGAVKRVAGIDVGFRGDQARAAVVVLRFPDLDPVAHALAEVPVTFPYVPGLLAFREGPAVLAALEKLTVWPDLFVFDAQGRAHPRRLGLASHMGVILDRPSIGCAKSRLVGTHAEPGDAAGEWTPLLIGSEIVGAVLRTKSGSRPVYVSVGHLIDLPTAVAFVLRCTRGYRLPEPTRLAHNVAGGAALSVEPAQPRLF